MVDEEERERIWGKDENRRQQPRNDVIEQQQRQYDRYQDKQDRRNERNVRRVNERYAPISSRQSHMVKFVDKRRPEDTHNIGGRKQAIINRLERLSNAFKNVPTDPYKNYNWEKKIPNLASMHIGGEKLRIPPHMTGKFTLKHCLPNMKKFKFKL